MVSRVQVINWQPTTASGIQSYVGIQKCDAVTDTNWAIGCKGTRDDIPKNIVIKYALVDNIANNAICTISFGPFTYSIPQFTRKTFRLPDNCDVVNLNLTTGIVTIYLVESRELLSDDANLYNISTAAGTNVVYTWVTYTAAVINQVLSTDSNHNLSFSRAGGLQYNLLAVGSIPNGYINPCLINAGTGDLTIVPSGTDTIVGVGSTVYTNANPLVLKGGERILLSCDGSQWYAFDHSAFFTNHIFGTVGLNCDPVANANTPFRLQQRGFNDVGLEFARGSATEAQISSYDRNSALLRRLALAGSSFRLIQGSSSILSSLDSGTLANVLLAALSQNVMITGVTGDLAIGGSIDMPTNTGGGGFPGVLITSNTDPANAGFRTHVVYGLASARGAVAVFNVLAAGSGGGGTCTYGMSVPSNGVIRLTNTSGIPSHAEMAYFGLISF